MTIDDLRTSLEDKRSRGVKQVRVTTMLESLPATPAEAYPGLVSKPTRKRRSAGSSGGLAGHAYDNPVRYDTDAGEVVVQGTQVGTAEAAAILGVERPRIGKWRALNRMPPVVADLAAGPVWDRADIEAMRPETEARRRGLRRAAETPAG